MPASALEILALDRDGRPLNCAVKSVEGGDGLKTLRRWLDAGGADVLLLANGKGKPLVLMSWEAWNRVGRTVVRGDFSEEPRQPGYDHSPLARVARAL
jgi:hypothetical protein